VIAFAGLGRNPFQGDSPTATAARILTQAPDLTGLSPQMRALVERTLAKDPADRPTAHELLNLLLGSAAKTVTPARAQQATAAPLQAVAAPPERSEIRRHRRRRSRVGGLAAVGAAVVVLAAGVPLAGDQWVVRDAGAAPAVSAIVTPPNSGAAAGSSADPGLSEPDDGADAAQVGDVVIRDDLAKPDLWTDQSQEEGSCTYRDAVYRVQLELEGTFECEGPTKQVAGDQSIEVDLVRGRDGGCGSVIFLQTPDDHHELQICRNVAQINYHEADEVTPVTTYSLEVPVVRGRSTRVSLRIINARAQVLLNGRAVGESALASEAVRKGGRVSLAVFGEREGGEPPYDVTFGRILVRSVTG
jgi:hypothetical protein